MREDRDRRSRIPAAPGSTLTAADRAFVVQAEDALEDGLALYRWWRQADRDGSYAERFALIHDFHGTGGGYGFLDEVEVRGEKVPVMGEVQYLFFDCPKGEVTRKSLERLVDQVEEFALHYYLRVNAWAELQPYPESGTLDLPPYLRLLSWSSPHEVARAGMAITQDYFKLREDRRREEGRVGKFAAADRRKILDMRAVGDLYDWVILEAEIMDLAFDVAPEEALPLVGLPKLVLPVRQRARLVASPELVTRRRSPGPGVLGVFGPGYAFVAKPGEGLLAYGPEKLEPAVSQLQFGVLDNGEVWVRELFVARVPEKILNLSLSPVDWSFKLADVATFGAAGRLLAPLTRSLSADPWWKLGFNPVMSYIRLMNLATGGRAAEELCISRGQLHRQLLYKHAVAYREALQGTLRTWHEVRDWLDPSALPEWVLTGEPAPPEEAA